MLCNQPVDVVVDLEFRDLLKRSIIQANKYEYSEAGNIMARNKPNKLLSFPKIAENNHGKNEPNTISGISYK